MDVKAVPQATVSGGQLIVQRPSLARRDTQREARLNPKQFEERWSTGPFADVPDKRFGGVGPKLFTQDHTDLLRRMRMEGARTSLELATARRDLTLSNERHNETWRKLHKTRDEYQEMREQLHHVEHELRDATVALSELDAMYKLTRERRASRYIEQEKGKEHYAPDRVGTPDLYPDRAA
jgi:hypothetical protein